VLRNRTVGHEQGEGVETVATGAAPERVGEAAAVVAPEPANVLEPTNGPESEAELEAGTEVGAHSGSGSGSGLGSWMRDVVISVAVSAFIITFLYQPVRVEGTSMLPMLQDEDRLFINKMAYRVGEIHRGDVVVFLYPRDHSKSYIKRVIAVGGDDLRIEHGEVFVNGKGLKEPYVPLRFTDDRSQPEMVVPAHEYFMMGDHRSISSDSRDFGPVEEGLIYGKAAFVYWPIEQIGVVR
jgi:signal peptidase I